MIVAKPVLHLPVITKPFVLRINASKSGIGIVLLQDHGGQLFPVTVSAKSFGTLKAPLRPFV